MKILPSLTPFRSLGIEPSLLKTVSISSICLWRMKHGMDRKSCPTPDASYQAYNLPSQASVKTALFDARHALKDALVDSMLASAEFVNARRQQLQALQDDAVAHRSFLSEACEEAINQGLVSQRRMPMASALADEHEKDAEVEVDTDLPGDQMLN